MYKVRLVRERHKGMSCKHGLRTIHQLDELSQAEPFNLEPQLMLPRNSCLSQNVVLFLGNPLESSAPNIGMDQ